MKIEDVRICMRLYIIMYYILHALPSSVASKILEDRINQVIIAFRHHRLSHGMWLETLDLHDPLLKCP